MKGFTSFKILLFVLICFCCLASGCSTARLETEGEYTGTMHVILEH